MIKQLFCHNLLMCTLLFFSLSLIPSFRRAFSRDRTEGLASFFPLLYKGEKLKKGGKQGVSREGREAGRRGRGCQAAETVRKVCFQKAYPQGHCWTQDLGMRSEGREDAQATPEERKSCGQRSKMGRAQRLLANRQEQRHEDKIYKGPSLSKSLCDYGVCLRGFTQENLCTAVYR